MFTRYLLPVIFFSSILFITFFVVRFLVDIACCFEVTESIRRRFDFVKHWFCFLYFSRRLNTKDYFMEQIWNNKIMMVHEWNNKYKCYCCLLQYLWFYTLRYWYTTHYRYVSIVDHFKGLRFSTKYYWK